MPRPPISLICPPEWKALAASVLMGAAGFALMIGNLFDDDEED